MPSSNLPGDPGTGRGRRVPARGHTFKHGTVDPVSSYRKPLLTIGNLILLVLMVGFGLYATGNLPQLDAFFDQVNNYGRAHNNLVVNTLITYGAFLFGALVLVLVLWMVFLFINAERRSRSDPKGWHKITNAPPQRRHTSKHRRNLPSMVMPIGKVRRPTESTTPKPVTAAPPPPPNTIPVLPTVAEARTPEPVKAETPKPDPAKAEAIAAAAKAEAALRDAPADLPSFVRPFGKSPKNAETPTPTAPPAAIAATATAPATDTSFLAPTVATAQAEANIAAAKATAAKAEAVIAAAKAEAAIAAAKAELAIAEAAIAAAKVQTLAN